MGQVVHHPLQDWSKLDSYRPPDPRDPFYFARIEQALAGAADRYTVVTCHFNLIERLHMLHGFAETLADFHLEPVKIEKLLDMILAFKMEILQELHRRFGDRVQAVFLTDDWGTQRGTFISRKMFEDFFSNATDNWWTACTIADGISSSIAAARSMPSCLALSTWGWTC